MSKKAFFLNTMITPTLTGFQYGSPAGAGGTDGGGTVKFQYIFDEASGNLTDEVQGIVLTSGGLSDYSLVVPAPYNNLSPGIRNGGTFTNNTPADLAATNINADDFVFEAVLLKEAGTNPQVFYETDASNALGVQMFFNTGSDNIIIFLEGHLGTQFVETYNGVPITGSGLYHKLRIVGDRAGLCRVFMDGVELTPVGSGNISALAGQNIESNILSIGASANSLNRFQGIIAEVRLTTGTITANSGGTGGG